MNVLEHLEGLFSDRWSIIKTVINLAKLEARLAGLSVYPLLFTLGLLLVVLMTTWLTAMLLLGYCFKLFIDNPLWVISFILLIHVGLLVSLAYYLLFNLKQMSFEKTRAYFSEREGPQHDTVKKTIDRTNSKDGSRFKAPTNQSDGA